MKAIKLPNDVNNNLYSQAVESNGFIFTSGQVPFNAKNNEYITDISLATKQSLENLKNLLEYAGSSLDKVLKVTIYIEDLSQVDKMNKVYKKFFATNKPARSCVRVAELSDDIVIEIEAIAEK